MNEDIDLLKQFVSRVYFWLAECYGQPLDSPQEWPVIPLLRDFRVSGGEAWNEFSKEFPIERVLANIDKGRESDFVAHGLYGAQLRYKLALVDFASRAAKGYSAYGWKKKLIDLIDNVLDSIAGATGIPGALKELKDALVGQLPEDQ